MSHKKSPFARQRIVILRLVIWPLAAVLLLTTSAWELHPPIGGLIFVTGCLLTCIATVGRVRCSLYICGRKTKELVTVGPYSINWNPLYFFISIGAIGVGLATETFTVPILLMLLFAITGPSVIRAEENKLRGIHGGVYDAYVGLTPCFLPRRSRYSESDAYEVNPRNFLSALFDALWFVWLIGILELGEALREAGFVPSLLTLY